MNDQKIENQLNLALEATEREREKSITLETGYNREDRTWELIVKYTGDLEKLALEGILVTELLNEYAILTVPESHIAWLAEIPEIEYIEKPKRLYFNLEQGRSASCINTVQKNPVLQNPIGGRGLNLSGKGVLIGIIDSGECVIILFGEGNEWCEPVTREGMFLL